jgi:hypothetical protein
VNANAGENDPRNLKCGFCGRTAFDGVRKMARSELPPYPCICGGCLVGILARYMDPSSLAETKDVEVKSS